MKPSVQFERQFISPSISQFLVELQALLEKHRTTISFEAETLYNQGSLLTILNDSQEKAEIEVASPQSFDLDAKSLKAIFGQVLVI